MASLDNPRLNRRLDAVTEAVRRGMGYRQELRDLAKACATIRAALAEAKIDPEAVPVLRRVGDPDRKLGERGECPELQRADAAFAAQDPELAARESGTERWAKRKAAFAGKPPPGIFGSLADWYAWSLTAGSTADRQTRTSGE